MALHGRIEGGQSGISRWGLISDRPTGSSGCRAFAAAVQSATNFGLDGAGDI
jgi:hypothetical protein